MCSTQRAGRSGTESMELQAQLTRANSDGAPSYRVLGWKEVCQQRTEEERDERRLSEVEEAGSGWRQVT